MWRAENGRRSLHRRPDPAQRPLLAPVPHVREKYDLIAEPNRHRFLPKREWSHGDIDCAHTGFDKGIYERCVPDEAHRESVTPRNRDPTALIRDKLRSIHVHFRSRKRITEIVRYLYMHTVGAHTSAHCDGSGLITFHLKIERWWTIPVPFSLSRTVPEKNGRLREMIVPLQPKRGVCPEVEPEAGTNRISAARIPPCHGLLSLREPVCRTTAEAKRQRKTDDAQPALSSALPLLHSPHPKRATSRHASARSRPS